MSLRIHLTFAAIDAFDPDGPPSRRLCPLCGKDKPRDSAHRSLSLDRATGLWKCFRCNEGGKVEEKWEEKSQNYALQNARNNLRETFSLPVPIQVDLNPSAVTDKPTVATHSPPFSVRSENISPSLKSHSKQDTGPTSHNKVQSLWDWMKAWEKSPSVTQTVGEEYLRNRALSPDVIAGTDIRFCHSWSGRASVVFPIQNRAGEMVATQGRAVKGSAKRTFGTKKEGAFFAPVQIEGQLFGPLDLRVPAIILVEAPIDALSLSSCGFPALALCGTTGPTWLHIACGLRRVLLAFDADAAGDDASEKLALELEKFGAKCERLRPDGFKDWNDALRKGQEKLTDWLTLQII